MTVSVLGWLALHCKNRVHSIHIAIATSAHPSSTACPVSERMRPNSKNMRKLRGRQAESRF
eukprot:2035509-Amphidinium_carterae.1